ncbi:uncharacterized protein LOC116347942 [Contarinia nasturtii]|uniref:uncharacterized protein LOC116347942 n=1 Tax=Contarinia nasturtii TaxID=265458 RepID=UPI0012D497A1|nr:uncharacterized protein LOC116347942 [Contarinia nasturtii]XP_031634626.1 uncharacterized protein LOC116347942 [Contarinia nasturtii]XP_031634627.1 uncharacterized protein LOC116347942 [Contarinia nasturtii]XP_031634628.1 uncharacterized protein LOC116347942 [Contarinia nasturtii]
MERSVNSNIGPKVSQMSVTQIANLFQRRPTDAEPETIKDSDNSIGSNAPVVRTESHAVRFNNARALFEKLGVENRTPRPVALSLKNSNSRDNLSGSSPERSETKTPSPKHTTNFTLGNGVVAKRDPSKIHNTSRVKPDKPEKPEKPERKFNSKELIEKQKNWTSHFTKTRTSRFNSDPNRCDIIRAGAALYPGNENQLTSFATSASIASILVSNAAIAPTCRYIIICSNTQNFI